MSTNKIVPDDQTILKEIRQIIPKHCFDRSVLKSFYYVFQDLVVIGILFWLATFIDSIPFVTLRWLTWATYWWIQGAVMTGIWVIAHECGHGSFSKYEWLNDLVGSILHSSLFVPYWSWKYSHAKHHSNTDSLERDTVFVPYTKQQMSKQAPINTSSIMRLIGIIKMVTLGWPLYLLLDVSGPPNHSKSLWNSHYNPFCDIFVSFNQRIGVIASDIILGLWVWILFKIYTITSLITLIKYYFIPYLVVNFWLVTITFLQHTDSSVPRYRYKEWTWLRGALGTVDRDYGIFNYIHHHIADTHVIHHIFSKIPHYHAVEATNALKKSGLINDFYLHDTTSWYKALWRSYRDCWFVGDQEQITWFQSCKSQDSNLNKKSL